MSWKVDYVSRICIQVEADSEDEAVELAQKELRQPMNIRAFATNADIEGVTCDDDDEEE